MPGLVVSIAVTEGQEVKAGETLAVVEAMKMENVLRAERDEVHARSLSDPEGFWAEAAREIDWIEPPRKIFDASMGVYGRWFAGGVVNTCYNALDRQVANGRGDQVALIHDSPLANTISKFTYAEMLREVQALAAVMQDFGVAKGDRVILYMPMVAEAVVAMLACARIGAVHSVVFGGFAAKELATRIEDAKPKLIFSASCGLEPGRIVQYKPLLDEAIRLSSVKPEACIVLQRPQTRLRSHRRPRSRLGPRCAAPRSMPARKHRASPCLRPIRSIFSTRRAPRAFPRGWCATMAAIWLR